MHTGLALFLFLALSFAAAATGSFFRPGTWYQELAKPQWTPPSWVFGPAWTLLYIAMAVSGWLAWRHSGNTLSHPAHTLFFAQLALNAAWSPVFFGAERPGSALIIILALSPLILATIVAFHPINRIAAFLLVPYLLWVGFATALNASIWHLNR